MRALARLCCVLVSGCAAPPTPPAVTEGDACLWRRVETEQVLVESNLPNDSTIRALAGEFETLWHALASVPVLGMRPPDEQLLVVALGGVGEYRYLAPAGVAGHFVGEGDLGPMIVLPPHQRLFGNQAVKHELAHFVVSGSLPHDPSLLWLHEGLAQVMETATCNARKGEVTFGRHTPGLAAHAAPGLPAALVMGPWPEGLTSEQVGRYYARSWLLVHYLIDHELQGFLDFLVRVRRGDPWRAAWSEELELRIDKVDEAIDRYHQRAEYGLWSVEARLPDVSTLEVRPVSAADALALRSVLLSSSFRPDRDRAEVLEEARLDLEACLALDPDSARARRIRAAAPPASDRPEHPR